MKLPKRNPKVREYLVELIQDPREANTPQAGLNPVVRMSVPREEFYNAALHFHSKEVVELFLKVEASGKYPRLLMAMTGVTLARYTQEMFKEGRWADKTPESNIHIIGGNDGAYS